MNRIFTLSVVTMLLVLFGAQTVSAQFTILPQTGKTDSECMDTLNKYEVDPATALKDVNARPDLLACAIKTGRVSLNMIPYFITYIANFLLGMGGLIAMLFIVIGGYYYIYGGLTDNKEKGKKTIVNALWGMGLAIVSWSVIQIILAAVTS